MADENEVEPGVTEEGEEVAVVHAPAPESDPAHVTVVEGEDATVIHTDDAEDGDSTTVVEPAA